MGAQWVVGVVRWKHASDRVNWRLRVILKGWILILRIGSSTVCSLERRFLLGVRLIFSRSKRRGLDIGRNFTWFVFGGPYKGFNDRVGGLAEFGRIWICFIFWDRYFKIITTKARLIRVWPIGSQQMLMSSWLGQLFVGVPTLTWRTCSSAILPFVRSDLLSKIIVGLKLLFAGTSQGRLPARNILFGERRVLPLGVTEWSKLATLFLGPLHLVSLGECGLVAGGSDVVDGCQTLGLRLDCFIMWIVHRGVGARICNLVDWFY